MTVPEVGQADDKADHRMNMVLTSQRLSLGQLFSDRTAMVGVVIVVVFLGLAVLAPIIAPYDPNAVDVTRRFASPSTEFLLGTDHLGRDILSRLLYGAGLSIGSAIIAALGLALIGLVLGMVAGFLGGFVDTLISRCIDILLSFPSFLLALAVTGVLGPGLGNLILVMVAVSWASYARIVRASVLAEAAKPYLEAGRALGASNVRLLWRHLLPNVVAPVVVLTTLDMGGILLGLSALSFLGLGVQPPTPEWGAMLSEGKAYLGLAPNMMLFPGLAILMMVLGFNLVGDGLRDVLDPQDGGRTMR